MRKETKADGAVMIAAFEGWNDACQAATDVVRHLVDRYAAREVRHIRCDGFYDYRSTRPIVCYATGRRRIVWPQTTFYDIEVRAGRHIYAQIAPEPNYRWREYCQQTLRIAEELEVGRLVTLGSMFADCPHTRSLPLDVDDGTHQLDPDQRYSGPAGIPTVLDAIATDEGFDAATMWVSIPQYLDGDGCAQATLQMVEGLGELIGERLDTGDLPCRAERWRSKGSVLVRCNDGLAEYVSHLEREHDRNDKVRRETTHGGPQCEQLIKEAEAYLKSVGE